MGTEVVEVVRREEGTVIGRETTVTDREVVDERVLFLLAQKMSDLLKTEQFALGRCTLYSRCPL